VYFEQSQLGIQENVNFALWYRFPNSRLSIDFQVHIKYIVEGVTKVALHFYPDL